MALYTLMRHQRKGLKFLKKMDGVAALLFEPGVGKTGTTLAYFDHLAEKQGEVRVLVVSPLSASDTWVLQPELFMDSAVKSRFYQGTTETILAKIAKSRDWRAVPPAKIQTNLPGTDERAVSGNRVTIVSISAGALSSWCTDRFQIAKMTKAVRAYNPHVIVVDESHIIKSPTANISRAMAYLGRLAPRRIILTGTVTPKDCLDVYGQWRFLAPWTYSDHWGKKKTNTPHLLTERQITRLSPWPFGRFKNKYTESGGYEGREVVGYVNQKDLKRRMAERSMVVRKADALDLPPTRDMDIFVDLSPREAKAYREMKNELLTVLESGDTLEAPNAAVKFTKLRQITTGSVKDTETGETLRIGRSKERAVVELVNTQLVSEKRVVVFAYFKSECKALAEALTRQGRTVELITGKTKPKERLAIRTRFKKIDKYPGPIVLVAQARTMSLSVNELVTAQHAIFASFSERRDDWVQGRGRLDRQGQTLPVTFWNILARGTVDEVMKATHEERGDMEKALLDHVQSVHKL